MSASSHASTQVAIPPLFLLARLASDSIYVMTEGKGREQAPLCFLSKFDALIEEECLVRSGGERHDCIPAFMVDSTAFLAPDRQQYQLLLHFGWPACNGQILRRPSGRPCGHVHPLCGPPNGPVPAFDQINEAVFGLISKLYEAAGLFAWQETARVLNHYPLDQVPGAIARAVASMPLAPHPRKECNQLALYDPEFEQWHFVPREAADW